MKSKIERVIFKPNNKFGISLIVLAITIVVALILILTTLISTKNAIDDTNVVTFAKDLTEIQDATESYYIVNHELPTLADSSAMSEAEFLEIAYVEDLLEDEIIENDDIASLFYTIDLGKINIEKPSYGSKQNGENDIFVVAYPTMNVYYPYGIEARDMVYFSITSRISDIVKLPQEQVDNSTVTVVTSGGITVTKNNGWSNQMGVSIQVNMDSDESLRMSISGGAEHIITTSTGANSFGFNLLSSLSNGTETMKLEGNVLSTEEIDCIESGMKPASEMYVDILKYKGSELIGKARIDLSNFNKTLPTIATASMSSYINVNTVKFVFSSNNSGISEVRYEYLKKYKDDGTIADYYDGISDFDSTYMKTKAKIVRLSNGTTATISIPKNVQKIRIAVIDKSGNMNLYDREDISPKLYIGYSLDSAATNLLQITGKVYSESGIKSVTFYKSLDGVNFTDIDSVTYMVNSTTSGVNNLSPLQYTNLTANSIYVKMVAVNYSNTITETRLIKVDLTDTIPPATPVLTASPSTLTNGSVEVTVTYPTDATIKEYSIDGIHWIDYTSAITVDKVGTIVYARAKDAAGNISTKGSLEISNIDNVSPVVSYGQNGSSDVKIASTKVTVSDANLNTSTLKYIWDTQNITEPTSGWSTFTNGTTITKTGVTGTYYLWITASDNIGNSVVSKSNAFIIDNTAPSSPAMAVSPTSWTNGNVLVTITYPSDAVTEQYSIDTILWYNYTGTITVNTNGTTVYARTVDLAGNQSSQSSVTIVNIDKIAPTVAYGTNGGSVYLSGGATTATVSTTVTVSDNIGGSNLKVSTLQYVWDTQNITAPASGWAVFTNGANLTKTTSGTYYLWIKAEDNIANSVVSVTNAFIIKYRTINGLMAAYNNPIIPQEFTTLTTTAASWANVSTDYNKGLVIQDSYGNQFVWVPVDGTTVPYAKWCTQGRSYASVYISNDTLPSGITNETNQITAYGGFYVGRYTAAFDYNGGSFRPKSIKSTNWSLGSWTRDSSHTGYLWNYINYTDAKLYSESMAASYGYTTVKTGLVTGTQWDTVMKWIQNSGISVTNSSTWGNYYDSVSPANVSGYGELQVSGYSEMWKAKNIYDLAGNTFEWSSEKYSTSYIRRSGSFYEWGSTGENPAAYRDYITGGSYNRYTGFRLVLYVL